MAGYYKSAGNLELKTVNNAGHLVPMDQGVNALEMVRAFTKKCLSTKEEQILVE